MQKRTLHTVIAAVSIVVVLIVAMLTNNGGFDFWANTGIWSITPLLILLALVLASKNYILALLGALISGAYLLSIENLNPLQALGGTFANTARVLAQSVSNTEYAALLLAVLSVGGLSALLGVMDGPRALADALNARARTPVGAQIAALAAAIAVFFDERASALTAGAAARPLTDRHFVSREKLAFLLGAGAPVSGLVGLSSMLGITLVSIASGLTGVEVPGVSAQALLAASIPYRFYSILLPVFALTTAITLREFGPMRKAELRARAGDIQPDEKLAGRRLLEEEFLGTVTGRRGRVLNILLPLGLIPLVCVLMLIFLGLRAGSGMQTPWTAAWLAVQQGEAPVALLAAVFVATLGALILGMLQKRWSVAEAILVWLAGIKRMTSVGVMLILLGALGVIHAELGTADFVAAHLSQEIPAALLPVVCFAVSAVLALAVGGAGSIAALMPLVLPMAYEVSGEPVLLAAVVGAVLAGAAAGRLSPLSPDAVVAAAGADCDVWQHIRTQALYAGVLCAISVLLGFLPVGLGLSVWVALPLCLAACVGTVFLLGRVVKPVLSAKVFFSLGKGPKHSV